MMSQDFKVVNVVATAQLFKNRGELVSSTPKIQNIVAVKNTGFQIDIEKLSKQKEFYYQFASNGIDYYKIRLKGMKGKITVFYNGNLISVGTKSISDAEKDIELAVDFLKKFRRLTLIKR